MYVETKISPAEDTAPPGMEGHPAILCVDDDVNILDGFRRQLRKKFRIHTAIGALEALEVIEKSGPFGVVMSDLQMPDMDGIQFLTKVRAISPNTVRIMLTGRADISTAMAAVNQGNIFRFLVKPCAPVVIEKVLEAAIEQHKLLLAERQLMQETLLGCVQVLVEVLSLVQPEAFSRSTRVRRHVKEIAGRLGMSDTWQLEAAAMLSQIGWITLHPNILAKAVTDIPMSAEEERAFLTHASAAARIVEKIPRLGPVARMIEKQHGAPKPLPDEYSDVDAVGAHLLKAAIDFDRLCSKGVRPWEAIERMRQDPGKYMPEILSAMDAIEEAVAAAEMILVPLSALSAGMFLGEDLRSEHGLIVLGKGQEITPTFAERLLSFDYGLPRERMFKIRLKPSGKPVKQEQHV